MPDVIYAPFTSLDGFVTDAEGGIDFHTPDEDVHRYINELELSYSDHIYDERTYHVMKAWERLSEQDMREPIMREYAVHWRSVRKTVVTMAPEGIDQHIYTVVPGLTREVLAGIIASATGDIVLSGAQHAAFALEHGQLDRIHLGIVPVILGGGTPLFSGMGRTDLALVDTRPFASGWVFLRYDVART
jgi:dihydrofolate reductase